jgi:hypothetical protein
MNLGTRALSMLLVAVMSVIVNPLGLWATSAVPEPGALGIPINPNAFGKRVSGSMTVAYDIREDFECPGLRIVDNVFIVAELQRRRTSRLFSRALNPAVPYCFGEETPEIQLVMDLITAEVIPFFFGPCEPGLTCPNFEIKSIKDFQSSGTGALSLDLILVVPRRGATADD